MFGLMRHYRCSSSKEERIRYRQQYCGVCKSLGRLYGQHTRFLLNRDLVFLSEVLTELSTASFPADAPWNRPFSRIDNCFKLPGRQDEIPPSFQIAATYNVLMSRYKVEDNIADTQKGMSLLWRSVAIGFSRAFNKAMLQAESWAYPLDEVTWWMEEQRRRETKQLPPEDAELALHYFAEPSAHTSGLSMKQAALIIERPDKADQMYALGYCFGKLIYLLDALEDCDEDYEKQQFNALRAAYRLIDKEMPAVCRQDLSRLSRSLEKELQDALSALQLPEQKFEHFKVRLARNLRRKLVGESCSPRAKCDNARQAVEKMKLPEKWRYAKDLSRKLAFSHPTASMLAASKAYLSFLTLFVCIFSTPQQVLGYVVTQLETNAVNSSDCISLVFLLSWISLALGMAFRRPKSLKLTKQSFETLKKDGVPEEILASLELLRGREFSNQDEFLQAIHNIIGEQTVPYQSAFLKHAGKPRRKFRDVDGSDDSCNWGPNRNSDCICCCDCCNCITCFPESCDSGGGNGGCDCGDCGGGDGCDCGSCGDCGDGCSGCDCGGCDCDCG